MTSVRPFKAIRPTRDKVHLVASRSYVSYSRQDLREKLAGNPYTFLHIIHPDNDADKRPKTGSIEYLKKIKSKFEDFRQEGYFIKDREECFYIYEQDNGKNVYRGLIACASIDDYMEGNIKKHEETLENREKKLKKYLDVVDINAEPVCFSYPDNEKLEEIIDAQIRQRPEYEFSTTDMVKHRLWLVNQPEVINSISEEFHNIPSIYIADGHHRTASSARFGMDKREKDNSGDKEQPYNYFMGFFLPESQLTIRGFHRLVKDLGGHDKVKFLKLLEENFTVKELKDGNKEPAAKNTIHLYFGNNEWYAISTKDNLLSTKSNADKLDAAIVSEYILDPLLGIEDLRKDERVSFSGGETALEELIKRVDKGDFKLGIVLHPVTTKQLKAVADESEVMPPKSTWIEPKLRSGLTIYSLSED